MEKHRPDQGGYQDGRSVVRSAGRGRPGPDHLRDGPGRARHAVRHRLQQVAARIGLGTLVAVRGGYRENREVVSR